VGWRGDLIDANGLRIRPQAVPGPGEPYQLRMKEPESKSGLPSDLDVKFQFNRLLSIRSRTGKLSLRNKSDLRRPNGLSPSCSTDDGSSTGTSEEVLEGRLSLKETEAEFSSVGRVSQLGQAVSEEGRGRAQGSEFASASVATRGICSLMGQRRWRLSLGTLHPNER
jgi:hypothetical protein